jgi:hypothetical protein
VQQNLQPRQRFSLSRTTSSTSGTSWIPIPDTVARVRNVARPTHQFDATPNSLPIKMGGRGILSYKTIAIHAYAAASEAAELTLGPILTPEAPADSTQITTQHQRCQEIFAGSKEALLGSPTQSRPKPASRRPTSWAPVGER